MIINHTQIKAKIEKLAGYVKLSIDLRQETQTDRQTDRGWEGERGAVGVTNIHRQRYRETFTIRDADRAEH